MRCITLCGQRQPRGSNHLLGLLCNFSRAVTSLYAPGFNSTSHKYLSFTCIQ